MKTLLGWTLALIFAIGGVAGISIAAGRMERSALADFLTTDGCGGPCWAGIEPGRTSGADALAILKRLPEVDQDSLYTLSSIIQWRWRSDVRWGRTDLADAQSQIVIERGNVQSLELAVAFNAGDLVSLRGAPSQFNLNVEYGRSGLNCPYGLDLTYGTVRMRYVVLANCMDGLPTFALNTANGRYMISANQQADATGVVLHRFSWGGFKPIVRYWSSTAGDH